MAFAFVQSTADEDGTFGFGVAPTAGSIIVLGLGWEGATGTNDASALQLEGGSSFTVGTRVDNVSGDNHAQLLWLIGATTTNNFSFTLPVGATQDRMVVAEFTSSEAASLDTQNTGNGASGTSLVSGSINLGSAANWLAIGLGESYTNSATFSAHQINSVNADGNQHGSSGGGGGITLFWRLLSASFTGGTATCTSSANDAWICNIIAFKAGTGGGVITEQEGFRFRNDDGSETGATWKASQDTNVNIPVSQNFRLRFLINKR